MSIMKPRRKKALSVSHSCDLTVNGTPLRQSTIKEILQIRKFSKHKFSKPTLLNNISFEIQSSGSEMDSLSSDVDETQIISQPISYPSSGFDTTSVTINMGSFIPAAEFTSTDPLSTSYDSLNNTQVYEYVHDDFNVGFSCATRPEVSSISASQEIGSRSNILQFPSDVQVGVDLPSQRKRTFKFKKIKKTDYTKQKDSKTQLNEQNNQILNNHSEKINRTSIKSNDAVLGDDIVNCKIIDKSSEGNGESCKRQLKQKRLVCSYPESNTKNSSKEAVSQTALNITGKMPSSDSPKPNSYPESPRKLFKADNSGLTLGEKNINNSIVVNYKQNLPSTSKADSKHSDHYEDESNYSNTEESRVEDTNSNRPRSLPLSNPCNSLAEIWSNNKSNEQKVAVNSTLIQKKHKFKQSSISLGQKDGKFIHFGIESPKLEVIEPEVNKPILKPGDCKDSPPNNQAIKRLKAKEGKQLQVKQFQAFMDLFKTVEANIHLKNLVSESTILTRFKEMTEEQQYVLMKLFIWKKEWYNMYKFCNKAQIEFNEDLEKINLFSVLQEAAFVDSDYMSDDLNELLNQMDVSQIKDLMKKLRITPAKGIKKQLVATIIDATRKQNTLTQTQNTLTKTLKDIVLKEIRKKLGDAIKIRDDVCAAFNKIYVLATFTDYYPDVQDYFRRFDIILPDAPIEDYCVFSSSAKFEGYIEALNKRNDLEGPLGKTCRNNKIPAIYSIATDAYNELVYLTLLNEQDHEIAPHLNKFTSKHVYCGVLWICCQKLFTKKNGKPEEVKTWLEFLIKTFPNSTRLGRWYHKLVWIHMKHLDIIDYKTGADILMEALYKKHLLNEEDVMKLEKLGWQLLTTKTTFKLEQVRYNKLDNLLSSKPDLTKIPTQQIDAHCIRSSNSGRKRIYISKSNGEITASSVEEFALHHYKDCGYPDGSHCEGSLIKALLMLYFWDIIYNPKKVVRGSFISKWQSAPLDMFTRYFYGNRKDAIDKRLFEIESGFSQENLIQFGTINYQNHAHKHGAEGRIMDIIKDVKLVGILVTVIGRIILGKIFERLIKNLDQFRSGMPDLLIWNIDKQIHKFVEVKGEGDVLSPNQTLWLVYLQRIGASVEVCWVHSKGSKRKLMEHGDQNEPTATSDINTSSSDEHESE